MQRVHRDSMPKLVQPGRRRDKWREEQAGTWVKGGPGEGSGFIANRQHVRMRMSHGRKRGPSSDNNAEPQPKQPWKGKKKVSEKAA